MTDHRLTLNELRRPRLLIRAARAGAADYRRDRDLCRLLSGGPTPAPAEAVERLIAEETTLETTRRRGAAGYSPMRHVEVLIALMSEARLLPG